MLRDAHECSRSVLSLPQVSIVKSKCFRKSTLVSHCSCQSNKVEKVLGRAKELMEFISSSKR